MVAPTPPPGPAFGAGPYGYSFARRDPTAVMGRRIGAFFIDGAVTFVILLVLFLAMADHVSLSEAERKYNCDVSVVDLFGSGDSTSVDCPGKFAFNVNNDVWVADTGALLGLNVIFSFAYYAFLPGLTGWTLGKLLVGIRIVDAQGRLAGVGRNIIRWLLFFVDGFFILPGLITSLASRGHRRIGDMAAGTFVVAANAVGVPPLASGPAPAPPGYGAMPQPSAQWPTPEPATPGAPPPPTAAPPPQWDEARSTYLQWDPSTSTWLQWDEGRRAWKPIDT